MHRTGRRFGGPFGARLPGSQGQDSAGGGLGAVAQPLSVKESTSARKKTLCALCTAMPMSALR